METSASRKIVTAILLHYDMRQWHRSGCYALACRQCPGFRFFERHLAQWKPEGMLWHAGKFPQADKLSGRCFRLSQKLAKGGTYLSVGVGLHREHSLPVQVHTN